MAKPQKKPLKDDFDNLENAATATKKDEQIQELQKETESLNEQIREQRFYYILVIVIIFDTFFFVHMQTWGAPIAILVLELLGLIAYANKCGVDAVKLIFDKFLDSWGKNGKSP